MSFIFTSGLGTFEPIGSGSASTIFSSELHDTRPTSIIAKGTKSSFFILLMCEPKFQGFMSDAKTVYPSYVPSSIFTLKKVDHHSDSSYEKIVSDAALFQLCRIDLSLLYRSK